MAPAVSSLEPIARRECSFAVKVSLRGTLAEQFDYARRTGGRTRGNAFVASLLASKDPDLLFDVRAGALCMGRRSDLGKFFPDW